MLDIAYPVRLSAVPFRHPTVRLIVDRRGWIVGFAYAPETRDARRRLGKQRLARWIAEGRAVLLDEPFS